MKKILRGAVSTAFRLLPAGMPALIYTKILRPAPLRRVTDRFLLTLVPPTVTLPEGELALNQRDPVVSGALALGVYENFELQLFRSLIKPGETVLDVGANIGLYSIIGAHRTGPTGRVIACEPEPDNLALLHHNALGVQAQNISVCACALADNDGTLNLYLSTDNKGSHSLFGSKSNAQAISVPVRRGDDLLAELGATPDVIKIDVEGAEPLVLAGLHKSLTSPSVRLFVEFSPGSLRNGSFDPQEFLDDLTGRGFICYEIDASRQALREVIFPKKLIARLGPTGYVNLLCVKNQQLTATFHVLS